MSEDSDALYVDKLVQSEKVKIKGFKLYNGGGFVCKGKVNWYPGDRYTWTFPNNGINVSQSVYRDLKDLSNERGDKIPVGASVSLYIDIVWGDDRSTGAWFEFDPNSKKYVEFTITGSTYNSHVSPPSIVET